MDYRIALFLLSIPLLFIPDYIKQDYAASSRELYNHGKTSGTVGVAYLPDYLRGVFTDDFCGLSREVNDMPERRADDVVDNVVADPVAVSCKVLQP